MVYVIEDNAPKPTVVYDFDSHAGFGTVFYNCTSVGINPLGDSAVICAYVKRRPAPLTPDKETGILHPGEIITMHYELPGLIADGSGFECFTLTARWLTEEEAANAPPRAYDQAA